MGEPKKVVDAYVVVSDYTDMDDLLLLSPFETVEEALADARDRNGVDGLERRVLRIEMTTTVMAEVR